VKGVLRVQVTLHRIPEHLINFSPTATHFYLDTLKYSKKYVLRFPYPNGIRVQAMNDSVATIEYGILTAELPVTDWGSVLDTRQQALEKAVAKREQRIAQQIAKQPLVSNRSRKRRMKRLERQSQASAETAEQESTGVSMLDLPETTEELMGNATPAVAEEKQGTKQRKAKKSSNPGDKLKDQPHLNLDDVLMYPPPAKQSHGIMPPPVSTSRPSSLKPPSSKKRKSFVENAESLLSIADEASSNEQSKSAKKLASEAAKIDAISQKEQVVADRKARREHRKERVRDEMHKLLVRAKAPSTKPKKLKSKGRQVAAGSAKEGKLPSRRFMAADAQG